MASPSSKDSPNPDDPLSSFSQEWMRDMISQSIQYDGLNLSDMEPDGEVGEGNKGRVKHIQHGLISNSNN